MVQQSEFFIDKSNFFCVDTGRIVTGDHLEYLVCLFNSKLFFYSVKNYYGGGGLGTTGIRMKHTFFENFPAILPENMQTFIEKANQMLDLNANLQKQTQRFQKLIQTTFPSVIFNKKLEKWHNLTFGEFRAALEKQKAIIPVKELMDYQDLFDTQKQQIQAIQQQINVDEKAIDKMVYTLYELTDEEIRIIENA